MRKLYYVLLVVMVLLGCVALVGCDSGEFGTPTGVMVNDDNVLVWNSVAGADGYELLVSGADTNSAPVSYTTDEASFSLNSLASGNYEIKLCAIKTDGDKIVESSEYTQKVYVGVIKLSGSFDLGEFELSLPYGSGTNKISVEKLDQYSGYQPVDVYPPESDDPADEEKDIDMFEFVGPTINLGLHQMLDPDVKLDDGYYRIRVKSYGDRSVYESDGETLKYTMISNESAWSDYFTFSVRKKKSPTVENLAVATNNSFSWDTDRSMYYLDTYADSQAIQITDSNSNVLYETVIENYTEDSKFELTDEIRAKLGESGVYTISVENRPHHYRIIQGAEVEGEDVIYWYIYYGDASEISFYYDATTKTISAC